MNIEALLRPENVQQQIEGFAHVERYVNGGSPSHENRTVSKPYSPVDGNASFNLPYKMMQSGSVLETSPTKEAKDFISDSKGTLRFFVHPDMTRLVTPNGAEAIPVFPTSSGRTVCVFEREKPLFIKLHYDGMLGRVTRRMKRNEVVQSLEVSAELDRQRALESMPETFGYLPETLGVLMPVGEKEIGYVVREFTLRGKLSSQDLPVLVPWFALFSADKRSPSDPSLLSQWIKILGQDSSLASASTFFKDKFLFPMIETFCYLADRAGFIVDYNAQNFLITPDSQANPASVVMRDMQSTWADLSKRREKGLSGGFTRSFDLDVQDPKQKEYVFKQRSLYFDHKFVEYILMPLIYEFVGSFGADPLELINEARAYLLDRFPAISEYFHPYDISFRQPPGIAQKDSSGQTLLTIAPKSAFR